MVRTSFLSNKTTIFCARSYSQKPTVPTKISFDYTHLGEIKRPHMKVPLSQYSLLKIGRLTLYGVNVWKQNVPIPSLNHS